MTVTYREITFPSRTPENTNLDALTAELAALPELVGARDALGNMQAAADALGNPQSRFALQFNEAGELVMTVPKNAQTLPIQDAVMAHIPTAVGRHDAEALALHIKAATSFADLQTRVTNNWLPTGARYVRDDFNRADENPAVGWAKVDTDDPGRLKVVSNQAAVTDVCFDYFTATTFGPDMSCSVTLAVASAILQEQLLLGVRLTNVGTATPDGYRLVAQQDGAVWGIQRMDDGAATSISALVSGPALTTGSKFRLDAVGDQLRAYVFTSVGWSQILAATDATYSAVGYAAIGCEQIDTRLDDFEASTL